MPIALDPHKWLHAPFEVGCAFVRDAAAHRGAFALTPEYLQPTPRGIASAPGLYEYGLQTSRGFRALKVWMALKEHGVEKFGRLIDQNIAQGRYLSVGMLNAMNGGAAPHLSVLNRKVDRTQRRQHE
ncbi:pyridoxal-dependent decarboxylase [Paraburkholderia youngii]|uniref:pyridoxal-dependent decarboxylase n=1 Tax=Paraburkholderia youngii TaxID=2782701 RepID=UPI003D23BAE6